MKRSRRKDEDVPWEDPNKLKIADLRQALSAYGIRYDESERRTQLFQRYVHLAQVESAESVELWTGHDFLDSPLPPASNQLVVAALKIFLALHKIDYPAQASRGHLVKLYNLIPKDPNLKRRASGASEVTVVIPPHPERKKRKNILNPISPHISEGNSNDRRANVPSYSGKDRISRARRATFLPYSRQSPCPTPVQKDDQNSRPSKMHSWSQRSRSIRGGKSPDPGSSSLSRAQENDSTSVSTSRRSLPRKSKSKVRQHPVDSDSCVPSSLVGESPRQHTEPSNITAPLSPSTANESLSQLSPSQEDNRGTEVPPLSEKSRSTRSSATEAPSQQKVFRYDHEDNDESQIPSSLATDAPSQENYNTSRSLSAPQEDDQVSEAPCLSETSRHSALSCNDRVGRGGSVRETLSHQYYIPSEAEDELASRKTKVLSSSGTSGSTRDRDKNDESLNVSSSFERQRLSQTLRSSEVSLCSPGLLQGQEDELDELASATSRSTHPVNEWPTLPNPPDSVLSTEPSLSAESTSSNSDSNSTVVPSRQDIESVGQQTQSASHESRCQSVPNLPEASLVPEDSQSEAPGQQTGTIARVTESSEIESVRLEEDSTQDIIRDESQGHSDKSSTSTLRNCQMPDQTSQSIKERVLKRRVQNPSEWPDALQLSRAEIQVYLDDHDVLYNRGARLARLIGSYNSLKTSLLSQHENAEKSGKRRRTHQSHLNVRDSPCPARRPRRRNRSRVPASSEDEDPGFVYIRPESPHRRPASPAPPSEASASNYEPSEVPTVEREPSVAPSATDVSEPSISTSTRKHCRESPPAQTCTKRMTNKAKIKVNTSRKQGRPRKEAVQRKSRLKRAPPPSSDTQINVDRGVNFCPDLPRAHPAPPLPCNSRINVDNEANRCLLIPRSRVNKKHRLTPSPEHANQNHHTDDVSYSLKSQQTRGLKQTTRLRGRQERSARDRYAVHPSFHHDEVIPPPSSGHLSHPPQPSHHDEVIRPPPVKHLSRPSQQSNASACPPPQHEHVDSAGPQMMTRSFLPPRARSRKRKQREDRSPPPLSKRRPPPGANDCVSSVHSAILRSSARRRARRRDDRIREKRSYTPHPSMHDDLFPEYLVNCNRVRNVETWMSSLPPDLELASSPLPSAHVHRTHNLSTTRQCDCPSKTTSKEFTLLNRIADNVELIAAQGTSNQHRGQRQTINSGPSRGYRDLSLLARVRLHIRALLGKCMEKNQFPPPATQREKLEWKQEPEDESDDERMSNGSCDALQEDADPGFPYPDAPGHRDLSAAALAIMWRSMRQAGVVSFRPDFSRGPRDTDNVFLWNLAHSIFIKLVKAGEYEEIDLEVCTEAMIRQAILNHAKQLNRQYREAGWNPDRLDERAVRKRRQERTRRHREHRIKYLSSKPGLAALIPVVTKCTSDAETDDEGSDSDVEMNGTNLHYKSKRTLVQVLPWRHPRLTRAFILIDKLIDLKRESGHNDFGKVSHHRIRPCDAIKVSDRPCAESLPADCYDGQWLKIQKVTVINSLKIQPGPDLKPMIQRLEDLFRSK